MNMKSTSLTYYSVQSQVLPLFFEALGFAFSVTDLRSELGVQTCTDSSC